MGNFSIKGQKKYVRDRTGILDPFSNAKSIVKGVMSLPGRYSEAKAKWQASPEYKSKVKRLRDQGYAGH